MARLFIELVLFISFLFFVACAGGTPGNPNSLANDPNAATATISAAEGGSLTTPDGKLTLVIPPGALDEDTEISIKAFEGPSGTEYEFQPDGLVFNQAAMAHFKMDLDQAGEILDENGEPLDRSTETPDVKVFLRNADGSGEILDNLKSVHEGGSRFVDVTVPIPHFTGMMGTVGNSYYVYMTSLGTHYVGSDFKADVDIRYLGYSHEDTYLNMSIKYNVRSITVKKITFEVSGQIDIVSPKEITRSAFLNTRGATSSTRPKFNCKGVGNGTVKVTVDVEAVLEIEFQPENRKYVRIVKQSESTTRKGKCIARVGFNGDFNNGGNSAEVLVAMADPTGDYSEWVDGALDPVGFVEIPGFTDYSKVFLGLHNGETLEANFAVNGLVQGVNPEYLQYQSFNLAVLGDESNESSEAFAGASGILAFEAAGPGMELLPVFYGWDPELQQWQAEEIEFETALSEQGVGFLIQLGDLGLTGEEALATDYRAVSFIETAEGYPYSGSLYVDTVDISF